MSDRLQRGISQAGENLKSLLKTNTSDISEITDETSRGINSEISSQMSSTLEANRIDLNAHVLEVINSAIEEKELPTIRNALNAHSASSSTKFDLRSKGHYQRENVGMSRKTRVNLPNLKSVKSNRNNQAREISVDSYEMVMVTTSNNQY